MHRHTDRNSHGEEERKFFDRLADEWDDNYIRDLPNAEYFASLLDLEGNESILDVGTGTGVMIQFYEKYLTSGNVHAIDISDRMIELAKKKYPVSEHPNVDFEVRDVYDLERSGRYDVVVCNSCLPHFYDHQKAIEVLAGCLKNGGKFIVASSSREDINHVHMHHGAVIHHDIVPSLEELENMFAIAGLTKIFGRSDKDCHIMIGRKVLDLRSDGTE
jgi:demethylmenaquinone methyltransferase/2-methoxy-6-polyprenyl-1,4-benzoquinol methylase